MNQAKKKVKSKKPAKTKAKAVINKITLLDLLKMYSAEFFELEKVKKKAAEIKLGHYTKEQQADEFAMSLLFKMNSHPEGLYNYLLKWQKVDYEAHSKMGLDRLSYSSDLPFEECQKEIDSNWTSGRYIPVANYKNLHHSGCHRLYRISKFLEYLRRSVPSVSQAPVIELLSENQWRDLQNTLPIPKEELDQEKVKDPEQE